MAKNGLIPNSARTREELAANGRKGGLKAAETKRRAREIRALLCDFLNTPVSLDTKIPTEIADALRAAGYKDITLKERAALLLAYKMSLGDTRAAVIVAKMIGEYTEEIRPEEVAPEEVEAPIVITVASEEEAADLRKAYGN